ADGASGHHFELSVSPDGASAVNSFWSPVGNGSFDLGGGLTSGLTGQGELHLQGLDSLGQDDLGKGGDMVTGTVASVVHEGASTLTGFLTEGAGALTGGIGTGAETAGSMMTSGATQAAGAVEHPTAVHLPNIAPAGLAD